MRHFLMWLLRLLSFGKFGKEPTPESKEHSLEPAAPQEIEEPTVEPTPPPEDVHHVNRLGDRREVRIAPFAQDLVRHWIYRHKPVPLPVRIPRERPLT